MGEKVLVSPSELSDMMRSEPVVLIDTRDPAIYAEAHIPGAVDVREVFTYLATSTPQGLAALRDKFAVALGKAGLSGAETAVFYEQSMNTGFGQSCRGYVLLRYLGYPKIRILHGGYSAWVGAGASQHDDGSGASRGGLPGEFERHERAGRPRDHEIRRQGPAHREAGCPGRGRMDWRELLSVRQGFLSTQGAHPRLGVDRVVQDDDADTERADVQVERGDSRRMRDGRHHTGHACDYLLLQGRAGVEHVRRARRSGGQECRNLSGLMERMVA
jgi:rhodanese-related sulfurtransferase